MIPICTLLKGETSRIMWLRKELTEIVYILLAIVELGISISGLWEKDNKFQSVIYISPIF